MVVTEQRLLWKSSADLCSCAHAAMCGCWLGRRAWRDHKRQMMDDCMDNQGPTDWEIDMSDIK